MLILRPDSTLTSVSARRAKRTFAGTWTSIGSLKNRNGYFVSIIVLTYFEKKISKEKTHLLNFLVDRLPTHFNILIIFRFWFLRQICYFYFSGCRWRFKYQQKFAWLFKRIRKSEYYLAIQYSDFRIRLKSQANFHWYLNLHRQPEK